MTDITIVGGGLAGLVAAIHLASHGARVKVHERRTNLGGRAATQAGAYKTNLGPHALYTGSLSTWLDEQDLLPATLPPRAGAFTMVWRGERLAFPPVFEAVLPSLALDAPVDRDYQGWATEHMGAEGAAAAIAFLSLPTYHADPGQLSAAFAHERLRRSFQPDGFCYIAGGWTALIAKLEARARALGVVIEARSTLSALPPGPVIVATELTAAARLLGKPTLHWPGAYSALLDVAFRTDERDPVAVLDLDVRVYVARYTGYDPGLAPAGEQLIQCCAGVREDEALVDALARIHGVLDRNYPGWRTRTTWSYEGAYRGASPLDLPGTSWRDRPAIEQGERAWLAGDHVAAPGLLAEVSYASAVAAADAALQALGGARRAAGERG